LRAQTWNWRALARISDLFVGERLFGFSETRKVFHQVNAESALAAFGIAVLYLLYLVLSLGQLAALKPPVTSLARETTAWLNAHIAPDELIESYEPEIFSA